MGKKLIPTKTDMVKNTTAVIKTGFVAGIAFLVGSAILGIPIGQLLAGVVMMSVGGFAGAGIAGGLLAVDGMLGLFGSSILG